MHNAYVNNKEVEFYFKNGTQLEISEKGGIIQINSLEIIEYNNWSKIQKWNNIYILITNNE